MLAAAVTLAAAVAPASAGPKSSGRFPETLPALHAEPDPADRGRIVDARGREVLLRGINVDVLADLWRSSELPTVQPFLPGDLALLRGMGFNVVRLQLSWSRIEPRPGAYDEAYLAEAERYIRTFRGAGMYTIVDLHQDAWGASLAARPGEQCPPGLQPAIGWDGAPAWATLVADAVPRCFSQAREINPAVEAAWAALWDDAPGPDTFGIRTRYASMLGHVARRLSAHDSVAGYDVINEPAAFTPEHRAALADLYSSALREIRAGERLAKAPPRLVLFQPDVRWSFRGRGAPPDFARDRDVVYAPHAYARPVGRSSFQVARDEARQFGGAPVFIGEWGTEPDRGAEFSAHQDLQDTFAVGSALWTWREGCGSPRMFAAGPSAKPWGLYDVDCRWNATVNVRDRLARRLTRAYVRAAPGRLHGQRYAASSGRFSAAGEAPAGNEQTLLVFYPGSKHPEARFRARGLTNLHAVRTPGEGRFVVAIPRGVWSLEIGPRLR
ncbi:MAG TPA: cellulase family glycosylhydrolase [Solirubrobacteraceae bacterium]|nr:cellulase family glycosylhydrolase [Solirubrobacteraceae bacterium]